MRGGRHVTFDIDGNVCPLQRVQHVVLPFPKAQAGRVHLSSSSPVVCAAFEKSPCSRLRPRDQITHHRSQLVLPCMPQKPLFAMDWVVGVDQNLEPRTKSDDSNGRRVVLVGIILGGKIYQPRKASESAKKSNKDAGNSTVLCFYLFHSRVLEPRALACDRRRSSSERTLSANPVPPLRWRTSKPDHSHHR